MGVRPSSLSSRKRQVRLRRVRGGRSCGGLPHCARVCKGSCVGRHRGTLPQQLASRAPVCLAQYVFKYGCLLQKQKIAIERHTFNPIFGHCNREFLPTHTHFIIPCNDMVSLLPAGVIYCSLRGMVCIYIYI